jgi:hypothetical protein
LDFGIKRNIIKVLCTPRNDKNHIIVGNEYELFYWDDSFKSLGKQIAQKPFLSYDNVPPKGLFLLKCHTEGTEERIFTFKDNHQVWW